MASGLLVKVMAALVAGDEALLFTLVIEGAIRSEISRLVQNGQMLFLQATLSCCEEQACFQTLCEREDKSLLE